MMRALAGSMMQLLHGPINAPMLVQASLAFVTARCSAPLNLSLLTTYARMKQDRVLLNVVYS